MATKKAKNYLQDFTSAEGVKVTVRPRSDGGLGFMASGYTRLVLKETEEGLWYVSCPQISGTGGGILEEEDQKPVAGKKRSLTGRLGTLITVLTVAMLPFMKGAVIGIAWANGITRETARQ